MQGKAAGGEWETNCAQKSNWSKWYQLGSSNDDQIYDRALKKCKEVNEQLNSQPWWNDQHGLVATKIVESMPFQLKRRGHYDALWVKDLVRKEREKIDAKKASDSAWRQKMSGFADEVIRVAELVKPIVDIFVPSSPEYSVPYACLWVVFKGISNRKEKKESIFGLMTSLSEEIPALQAYEDMFPTDQMKELLAQFYVHTVDLLWRLAKYYSIGFIKQLTDAILPRTKFTFSTYLQNIQKTSKQLKDFCEVGHMAEQKDMKDTIGILQSEIRHLRQYIDTSHSAQGRHYASDAIDNWHDEIGDIENEANLWGSIRFSTDMRDHWSQNGVLPCIAEWRQKCDNSKNSILWISSQSNGRQSWMTEFSLDLVNVCTSQGQYVIAGMCDRPLGVRWTPTRLLQQLIAQLLINHPGLTMTQPEIFNSRNFRRASSFPALCHLLNSCVNVMKPLLIIIDRLDLCVPGPGEQNDNIATMLSTLVKTHPHDLRVIVTTGRSPPKLPGLPISFAMVNTRRRPRRRENSTLRRSVGRVKYLY